MSEPGIDTSASLEDVPSIEKKIPTSEGVEETITASDGVEEKQHDLGSTSTPLEVERISEPKDSGDQAEIQIKEPESVVDVDVAAVSSPPSHTSPLSMTADQKLGTAEPTEEEVSVVSNTVEHPAETAEASANPQPSVNAEHEGESSAAAADAQLVIDEEHAEVIASSAPSADSAAIEAPSREAARKSDQPLSSTLVTEQPVPDEVVEATSSSIPLAEQSDEPIVVAKTSDKTNVNTKEETGSTVDAPRSQELPSTIVDDSLAARQIALLLKINKELIRLCVDLQAKELASDPIFRESATRLQTNLAFLASLAEPAKDSSDQAKPAVQLNHEPFPSTPYTSESLLPKLYAHLRSVTLSFSPASQPSPTALGKRQRNDSEDSSASKMARSKTPVETYSTNTSSPNLHTGSLDRRRSNMMNAPPFAASPFSATSALPNSVTNNSNGASRASTPLNSDPQLRPMPSPIAVAEANGQSNGQLNESTNGARPNGTSGPTPQQVQGLVQAFGQNAVNNLNALQTHYRSGQAQASVAYMEANVPNFRSLPLQVQLQHMANMQNAAMQRQRQMSMSQASSPGAQQQNGQIRPAAAQRRPSAAPSPSPSLNVEQMRRNTQSPIAAPGTPANMGGVSFANMASPSAASASSPSMFSTLQPQQQQQRPPQQQQQQLAPAQQMMPSSLPPSFANMPPPFQQQLLQHFLQQQQQQQQAANNQPMAPPSAGMNPMMLAMLQQQQQQQANTPMHMSQVGFRPSMSPQGWPNAQQPPS
jgi:hypothetical protein